MFKKDYTTFLANVTLLQASMENDLISSDIFDEYDNYAHTRESFQDPITPVRIDAQYSAKD